MWDEGGCGDGMTVRGGHKWSSSFRRWVPGFVDLRQVPRVYLNGPSFDPVNG